MRFSAWALFLRIINFSVKSSLSRNLHTETTTHKTLPFGTLLKVCYNQISDALDAGVLDAVAPNYAKAISYLNNIKELQVRINDDFSETDEEIEKIHKLMRDNGMGWILENLPKKVED